MGLGTSEMLLVLRARDEASRVVGRLGQTLRGMDSDMLAAAQANIARGGALVSLGAGMTAVGAAGAAFFASAVDAAGEYDTAARKALTQADGVAVSLSQLKDIGREVAREVPVAFEDIQGSLYDIFSTIDTDLPGAKNLLTEFSRASVAGQADLATATQGTLQVMNAFRLGTDGVYRANDVLFQLVRKGVGTYEEFVSSIGKAAPSASRAGQSIESLSGMMAFLTRNGLSTSMAATSAGRALDLISNSKVDERLQAMGIAVRDAQGEFRPMNEIVTDLGHAMENMTAPERANAMAELFKGSGNNVQARRFFDLAVTGYSQLNSLTDSMINSSGAMSEAYDIMFDSPQSQVQLLTNKYEAMKTEIGDKLLPAKLALLQVLGKMIDWWDKLPGPVQNAIIVFAALFSALMIIMGVLTMLAGAFLILQGSLMLMGTSLGAVMGVALPIIGVLIAIGAAVYLVIKYHEQIWDFIVGAWNAIVDVIKRAWDSIWNVIEGPVNAIWEMIQNVWGEIAQFATLLWDQISGALKSGWDDISGVFQEGIDYIVDAWNDFYVNIQRVIEMLQPAFEFAGALFEDFVDYLKIFANYVMNIIHALEPVWSAFWELLKAYVAQIWPTIQTILSAGVEVFIGIWNAVIDVLSAVWTFISNTFEAILDVLGGFISFFVGIFTGNWGDAWNGLVRVIRGVLTFIGGLLGLFAAPFVALWDILGGVFHAISDLFWGFIDNVSALLRPLMGFVGSIIGFFMDLPGIILSAIGDAAGWLYDVGKDIIMGLIHGLENFVGNIWNWVIDMFTSLLMWILSFFGIHSPSTVFANIGIYLLQGLLNGLAGFIGNIWSWFSNMVSRVIGFYAGAISWLWNAGRDILAGLWNGLQNIWGAVWGWISGIPGTVSNIFSGAASWLYGAGRNIIDGLWNGLKNMVGSVWSWIRDWAGGLINDVLDILGINSPSIHMIYAGEMLMKGLQGGIMNNAVRASDAAVTAAQMVNEAFAETLQDPNVAFDTTGGLSPYASAVLGGYGNTYANQDNNGNSTPATNNDITLQVYTNEINPLKNAAELGQMLQDRVS